VYCGCETTAGNDPARPLGCEQPDGRALHAEIIAEFEILKNIPASPEKGKRDKGKRDLWS
jgi:hypothetical protein